MFVFRYHHCPSEEKKTLNDLKNSLEAAKYVTTYLTLMLVNPTMKSLFTLI